MNSVLLVEDDEIVREVIARTLRARQFEVTVAPSGEDALALIRSRAFDMILSDVNMPGMDGFSFIRSVRMTPTLGQPEVIFISSTDDRALFKRAMNVGACDFLIKPFSGAELGEAVTSRLADRGNRMGMHAAVGLGLKGESGSALSVPGYETVRTLGEGASSKVLLAKHLHTGDQHALKLARLPDRSGEQREVINRFLTEYSMLVRISHRNVARVFEHGLVENYLYIGMEYLPGGDLRLDIDAGMAPKRAQKYAEQIAAALGAIHGAGIIHRDLKPANILMRMTGEAVLADFGIAKQIGSGLALTQNNIALGTPYYMSPEQATASPLDVRSDLYALGVLLFEMLTGRPPYLAPTSVEIMAMHVNAAVPMLPEKFAPFQPVLRRLLAKEPGDRYTSAEAAQNAIAAVQI
ncbi:MAG: protein kinase [Rhodocyclaceae bacterium]|jgi:serine/threonine protein kinase|nr:protein kinase [Rhodocyclaceae bacterium]MCA3023056.1 protein kinase [Rhodocyclaceae bacterium]MCA3026414.1 protein kinase [Rhodocyclaceae bacterium]MCA3029248.1 protein kinase [Rhodocyclaceae bacterium]MCA3031369.1 protein kinase [Rhodocyclaceae bacterium]